MTALERRLIATGFGMLLAFALPLAGDDLAVWLLWPFLIAGAVLLDRVPIEGSTTSRPVTVTSTHSNSDPTCGDAWDSDVGDCA
jgi:hypothetical protein